MIRLPLTLAGYLLLMSAAAHAEPKDVPASSASRQLVLEKRYVNLPVANDAPKRRMSVRVGEQTIREFDIELADKTADWWAFLDLGPYLGQRVLLQVDQLPKDSQALDAIYQSGAIAGSAELYREHLRPQFHFSQKRGWNNDPNGLVWYDGEYHLFFQHNPYGWRWANMHWGHAVSRDLVHWEELPIALYPWTMAKEHCFSGSAAVDWNNTAGFQTGHEKVLVAAFTDTGCGECIAYSNDRGRTWTYWKGNPVVEHRGRDPKIFWYEPGEHWVMAVYDELDDKRWIAFYTSRNLKQWQFQSRLEGYFECPEIFPLRVDADPNNTRWIVYAADARYAIGHFDGRVFTAEHAGKHQVHWGAYYASQTFNDAPDGRRIQIGWARIDMAGMPFNQMMTFPCQLTLRSTDEGLRLFAQPIREIEALHAESHKRHDILLVPDRPAKVSVQSDLLDIRAEFAVESGGSFGLKLADRIITYDVAKSELEGMPLRTVGGRIRMHVLVDRPSLELCGNEGRVYQTSAFRPSHPVRAVEAWCAGGNARLVELEVYQLRSIWP